MAGLVSLASALIGGPHGKTQHILCTALGEDGTPLYDWSPQFYPESISISMSADYAEKSAIGGSTTLKSWSSTSGRTISFSLLVAREINRKDDLPFVTRALVDPQSKLANNHEFNFDVRQELARWQGMMLPDYTGADGQDVLVQAPPVLEIEVPGLGWSLRNDKPDTIYGVVTSLSIEYVRIFTESGVPKQARIEVSISEVVQIPGQNIRFSGLSDIMAHPFFSTTDA